MICFKTKRIVCLFGLIGLVSMGLISCAAGQQKVIVVVGAPGEEAFEKQFSVWAGNWRSAIESANDLANQPPDTSPENDRADEKPTDSTEATSNKTIDEPNETSNDTDQPLIEFVEIGIETTSTADWERLRSEIESTDDSTRELWLVLIGHGTDDRKRTKFNLRGPDVAAKQLHDWLRAFPNRVIVINCASSSAGFIEKLKAPNRIVVTSTKSPAQHNFSRFGKYLAESIADPTLDLDKDQQTSLLEAFIAASAQTQEFYVQETRLATELALLDDNGDGKGTPGDWFQGTRVIKQAKRGKPDGLAANQVFLIRRGVEAQLSEQDRKRRDELEAKLEQLRQRKDRLSEDAYYDLLEPILVELARIYRESD